MHPTQILAIHRSNLVIQCEKKFRPCALDFPPLLPISGEIFNEDLIFFKLVYLPLAEMISSLRFHNPIYLPVLQIEKNQFFGSHYSVSLQRRWSVELSRCRSGSIYYRKHWYPINKEFNIYILYGLYIHIYI